MYFSEVINLMFTWPQAMVQPLIMITAQLIIFSTSYYYYVYSAVHLVLGLRIIVNQGLRSHCHSRSLQEHMHQCPWLMWAHEWVTPYDWTSRVLLCNVTASSVLSLPSWAATNNNRAVTSHSYCFVLWWELCSQVWSQRQPWSRVSTQTSTHMHSCLHSCTRSLAVPKEVYHKRKVLLLLPDVMYLMEFCSPVVHFKTKHILSAFATQGKMVIVLPVVSVLNVSSFPSIIFHTSIICTIYLYSHVQYFICYILKLNPTIMHPETTEKPRNYW